MDFQKTTRLKIGLAFGFLGFLVTFEPAICWGQAGLNPDHCDTTGGRFVPTVKTAADASGNTSKFRGKSVPIHAQQISASAVVVWNNAAIETARDNNYDSLVMLRALAMMHTAMFDAWAMEMRTGSSMTMG